MHRFEQVDHVILARSNLWVLHVVPSFLFGHDAHLKLLGRLWIESISIVGRRHNVNRSTQRVVGHCRFFKTCSLSVDTFMHSATLLERCDSRIARSSVLVIDVRDPRASRWPLHHSRRRSFPLPRSPLAAKSRRYVFLQHHGVRR